MKSLNDLQFDRAQIFKNFAFSTIFFASPTFYGLAQFIYID
jgi:hypothetical protein